MFLNTRKKGFTLAEVLITLAIIGVVAALTIPTLVKNYQKNQMLTQLKKAYSMINEALALSVVKNGQISEWDFATTDSANFTNQYILPFIKVTKNCGTGDGCMSKTYSYPKTSTLSPKYKTTTGNMTSFITADGTGVGIVCDGSGASVCMDLDGPEKGSGPYKSTMGKDRFCFYVYPTMKGTTLAMSFTSSYDPATGKYTSDRETNMWGCQNAGYCSAIILYFDKWQIKDDYPW